MPGKRPARLKQHLACCLVRFLRQMVQELGELPCLTDKESISGERLDGRYGAGKSVIARPNYCAERQIRADEFARNREDQAGLNPARRLQRWVIEKIRKRQPAVGHRCYRRLHAIARKIDPFEKVGDLVPANSQGDLQHFETADFLAHRLIQARSALFDISEVERSSVGDDLKVGGTPIQICIADGDRAAVGDGDRLRKCGAKVRVCRAAVTNVPAGVDVEMHQVGEAADVLRSAFVAVLPWSVRNSSKLTAFSPLETRYALRKVAWLTSSSVLLVMYCGPSESSCDRAVW